MIAASVRVGSFGVLDGRDIREVKIASADGALEASVIELGAAVRDLKVRRPDGSLQRVVLGLNSAADYRAHSPHMGAIAGRFGNRIADGRFELDGIVHHLPRNENGRTALHGGGASGFGKAAWTVLHAETSRVTLALHAPAGDNGYPGAITVTCRYSLEPSAILRLELWATTDAATVLNLCHHSYFNLDGGADVGDHTLEIAADFYLPVDADMIPEGALTSVAGSEVDFRKPRSVRGATGAGPRRGIDTTFMLRRRPVTIDAASGMPLAHAATLASARSGVSLQCWTTEPALQVYDGAKMAVPVAGLDGATYGAMAGIALEPQHVPDSPNQLHFPSTMLRPGELYRQITEYRF